MPRTLSKSYSSKRSKSSLPKPMTPRRKPSSSLRPKVGQKPRMLNKPTGNRRTKPRQIMGGTVVGLGGGVGNLRSVAEASRQTLAQAAPYLAYQSGVLQKLKSVARRKPKVRKSGTTYTPTTKRK